MSDSTGRIGRAFATAGEEERAALVIYTTAGFPGRELALDALTALADAGADVIELGVPFSDPLADGPTIQRSSYQALQDGVDLRWTIDLLRRFRQENQTPVVLFSYLNPILEYGLDRFFPDVLDAGADGVLLTDLPLGADPAMEASFEASALDLIRLIAPTTPVERARDIAAHSQGFVYYISRTGVTGVQAEVSRSLEAEVGAIRDAVAIPIAVGFGISKPEQAAQVAAVADGVVVGSAVVEALGQRGVNGAAELVASLRASVTKSAHPAGRNS